MLAQLIQADAIVEIIMRAPEGKMISRQGLAILAAPWAFSRLGTYPPAVKWLTEGMAQGRTAQWMIENVPPAVSRYLREELAREELNRREKSIFGKTVHTADQVEQLFFGGRDEGRIEKALKTPVFKFQEAQAKAAIRVFAN